MDEDFTFRIPEIKGAGPMIFIENDAEKTAENHEQWKDWLAENPQ